MTPASPQLQALIAESRADPRNPAIHNEIGILLLKSGNPAEAERAFLRCTNLAPDAAGAWHHLALAYQRQGKYTQAIDAYQKRIEIEPQVDAYDYAARLLLAIGEKAQALPLFGLGYELDP